jgi:hypothetical protein
MTEKCHGKENDMPPDGNSAPVVVEKTRGQVLAPVFNENEDTVQLPDGWKIGEPVLPHNWKPGSKNRRTIVIGR